MARKYRNHGNHSAMVLDRRQAAADLAAALLGAQADTAAAGLEERLHTVLGDGEEMPDVRLLIELLGRLVKQADQDLDQADQDRWLADMRLLNTRQDVGEARTDLYREAVEVRRTLVELYGADVCRRLFRFGERTPRGAEDLVEETHTVVQRLSAADVALPSPRIAVTGNARRQWLAALRPRLERLERLLAGKRMREIQASDGVIACRQALASYDATYLQAARTAEALFTLAGCRELSRRLRPSRSRLRKRRAATAATKALAIVGKVKAALASFFQWLRGLLTHAPSTDRLETPDSQEALVLPVARGSTTAPKA